MSNYWKSVASVLLGSAVAQLIPIVGALVIARQYLPSDFGAFSVWLGVVMVMSVLFTCRFETALAIIEDGEPRRLAVISTLITIMLFTSMSIIGLLIVYLYYPQVIGKLTNIMVVALIPTALLISVMNTWQSWAAAEGQYRKLSIMRITQALSITVLQIIIGTYSPAAEYLALGHCMGVLIAVVVSIFLIPLGSLALLTLNNVVLVFWKKQRKFPLFSLPADLINAVAAQLPVFIVAARFGAEFAGLLALTFRVLGAPIGLLGKSVLDVFKRHAASSFRERGECRSEYVKTFTILSIGSVLFCVAMLPFSEEVFAFAFGENWRRAGSIAIWLLPMFALRFVASPLSYMVYIAEKQHLDLLWQIGLLCMAFTSLSVFSTEAETIKVYSLGYSLMYMIYIVMSYRFSVGRSR